MAATPLASTASSSRTLVSAMFYSDQHRFPLPRSRPPLPGVRGHAAPAHHPLLRRPRASPTSSVRPQPPSMPPEHGIESASSSSSSTLSSRRRSIKACSFASPTPSSTSAPSSSSTPVAAPLLSPRQRQPQAFASSRIGSRSGVVRYDKIFRCPSASFNRYEDMFDEDDASKVTLPAWPGQGYGRHLVIFRTLSPICILSVLGCI
nr:uncharacterized protein LOC127326406 [Lolium perenne]